MFDVSLQTLALSALAIFISSVLRGLAGFGFSLAAVPLLSLAMPPSEAVPIALVIVTVGGLWGSIKAVRSAHMASVKGLALGAAFGSPIGALALKSISPDAARLAIALFTVFALATLGQKGGGLVNSSRGRDAAYGVLAGLFNGFSAMPGPPIVAYYLKSGLDSAGMRASMLTIFQLTAIAGAASAAFVGLISLKTLLVSACALPGFWVGNQVGLALFARSSDGAYRRIAIGCLAAMALVAAGPVLSKWVAG